MSIILKTAKNRTFPKRDYPQQHFVTFVTYNLLFRPHLCAVDLISNL